MNKKTLKRLINVLSLVEPGEYLRIRKMSDETSLLSTFSNEAIVNVMLPIKTEKSWMIEAEELEYIKAFHKAMKSSEEADMDIFRSEFSKEYIEPTKDADKLMSETWNQNIEGSIQFDMDILYKTFKAMKGGSSIIKLRHFSGERAIITNEEGDVSLIALQKII